MGQEALASVVECAGVRLDGEPCGSVIVDASTGFCYSHDPSKAEARRAARERGGRASANVVRLRRHLAPSALGGVFDRLLDALSEVHDETLSPARGSAMASIARALVAVLEVGELEERIQQLEAKLA